MTSTKWEHAQDKFQYIITTLNTCIDETCINNTSPLSPPHRACQQRGFFPCKQNTNLETTSKNIPSRKKSHTYNQHSSLPHLDHPPKHATTTNPHNYHLYFCIWSYSTTSFLICCFGLYVTKLWLIKVHCWPDGALPRVEKVHYLWNNETILGLLDFMHYWTLGSS